MASPNAFVGRTKAPTDADLAAALGAAKRIDEAPRYPEGTGIRFEVRRATDVTLVRKLARIKLDN